MPTPRRPTRCHFPAPRRIASVLAADSAKLFEGPDDDEAHEARQTCVLVEPLSPPPLLVIVGGGHVGQALARQAALVGFDLLVLDDRPEFTDLSIYPPGTQSRAGDVAEGLAAMELGGDTYVAIATRGHQHDRAALAACVASDAAYVGMIGSKRKVALIRQDLLESGEASAEQLARLYSPIGLDIGAQTVPEIATSIVAQLVSVRRKGSSPRLGSGPATDRMPTAVDGKPKS